ncbi:MAG TPA: hypothetical protein VLF68_03875 [Candidatus Saccharimonadales bacterium]|nr:hypothetical protein [Candidatus Saccharimonadales bacterium]
MTKQFIQTKTPTIWQGLYFCPPVGARLCVPIVRNESENRRDTEQDYLEPILYIPVPQTGHFAFIAGLPFFMVTCSGLSTSLFALHFTQYIDDAIEVHPLSI